MPYPVIALPQILHILGIEVACLVASAGDLVHIAGDRAEQSHQFLYTLHIQLDDIPVHRHLPQIPPQVGRAQQNDKERLDGSDSERQKLRKDKAHTVPCPSALF